jgi:hypothetical protein
MKIHRWTSIIQNDIKLVNSRIIYNLPEMSRSGNRRSVTKKGIEAFDNYVNNLKKLYQSGTYLT